MNGMKELNSLDMNEWTSNGEETKEKRVKIKRSKSFLMCERKK